MYYNHAYRFHQSFDWWSLRSPEVSQHGLRQGWKLEQRTLEWSHGLPFPTNALPKETTGAQEWRTTDGILREPLYQFIPNSQYTAFCRLKRRRLYRGRGGCVLIEATCEKP